MEDRVFNLLEKMYVDLSAKIEGLEDKMSDKIEGLDGKIEVMGKEISSIKLDLVRIENKMDDNHKVLQDGYKLTYEKLNRLEEKVDKIDKKVERHEVEIRVIKSVIQ